MQARCLVPSGHVALPPLALSCTPCVGNARRCPHQSRAAGQCRAAASSPINDPLPSQGGSSNDARNPADQPASAQPESAVKTGNNQAMGPWAKVKRFIMGGDKKLDMQRLRALGFGAFSAYGVISNLNASVLVTLAWLTIVRTQGVTPLDAGMWPKFLAVYAGLWVSSHFMRPIRLSLAIAAAPAFDAALEFIMRRTGFNKAGAFSVMLGCIFCGSVTFLLSVLTVCGGFPQGLPKIKFH